MPDPIPAVVCIDVEPDLRLLDRARAVPWRGFEALQSAFAGFRTRLAARTGAPAHFSWFLRLDPQVAETYGSPTWPVSTYRRFVEGAREHGDELGVHPHTYRWDGARGAWVNDYGNPSWVEHCVRTAMAAYQEALGSTCRSVRLGDHFMNDATVRLLEALGARLDLTLEPGMPAMVRPVPGELSTGSLPDLTAVPRHPYRPSPEDFRRPAPDRTDGLWMLPVTTARARFLWRHAEKLHRWLAGLRFHTDVMTLNLARSPKLFRSLLSQAVAVPGLPLLVFVVRADAGSDPVEMGRLLANMEDLAARLAERLVFVTPTEAARTLDLA